MEEVCTSKRSDEKIIYNMQEVRHLIPCSIHSAFLLWIMVEKQQTALVSISKFNHYLVMINSFKKHEGTALPETPCKAQPPPDLHRLGGQGWRAAQPGFWARGRGACRGGTACIAGGTRPSAPPGRPVETTKNHLKDSQCLFQRPLFKIGPGREVCQLLQCTTLAPNQSWIIASLHKLRKYSIITPGLSTLSVVQQGTSTAH